MKKETISFLNYLEGYWIRTREIHWSTDNNAIHKLCDEIMDGLLDYLDKIAESAMGMYDDKIQIGEFLPELPNGKSLMPMLNELTKDTLSYKNSLKTPEADGIKNILDEILAFADKYKYRSTQK